MDCVRVADQYINVKQFDGFGTKADGINFLHLQDSDTAFASFRVGT